MHMRTLVVLNIHKIVVLFLQISFFAQKLFFHKKRFCNKFLPNIYVYNTSVTINVSKYPFAMVTIWDFAIQDGVHSDGIYSGSCSLGIVSIRNDVHSRLHPFGIVFIRNGVIWKGWCPSCIVSIWDVAFRMVSIGQ